MMTKLKRKTKLELELKINMAMMTYMTNIKLHEDEYENGGAYECADEEEEADAEEED